MNLGPPYTDEQVAHMMAAAILAKADGKIILTDEEVERYSTMTIRWYYDRDTYRTIIELVPNGT